MKRHTFLREPVLRRAARAALLTCVALALPAAGWSPARATEPLPGAAQVIGRFIEVTGGQAARDSLRNHVIRATERAQEMLFTVTLVQARPNLLRSVLESPAIGRFESGAGGDLAWDLSPLGARIKEGPEKLGVLQEAAFDPWGDWRSLYAGAEVTGVDTVGGRTCYRVVLTPPKGWPRTAYFDRESGLLRRIDRTVENLAGTMAVRTFPADYRKVGGVLMPHRLRIVSRGQERVMTLDSVAVNVPLPAGTFEPPTEVARLLDAGGK